MHKQLRIFILLLILVIIALGTWATNMRATNWSHPLRVVIYPINGDQSDTTEHYITNLDEQDFTPIKSFFIGELEQYGITSEEPVHISLSPPVRQLPPGIPQQANALNIILWSLKLRYWAFQRDEYQGPKPEIQLFALYFDPQISPMVKHSAGLEKGHIAIINLFANKKQQQSNLFIITHELLHTLGATDKYNLANNEPIYPHGFAEPDLQPLYPQTYAEVMGGRIPITKGNSKIPKTLNEVIIGQQTASEIHLIK